MCNYLDKQICYSKGRNICMKREIIMDFRWKYTRGGSALLRFVNIDDKSSGNPLVSIHIRNSFILLG